MTSAEVNAAVAVVLGLSLVFPALALLLSALFPGTASAARDHVASRPLRAVGAGALVAAPALFATAVLAQVPGAGKLVALLLFALVFFAAFTGTAGLAAHVGGRLPSPGDAARPWLPTLRGAIVLEVACGLPIVGWFVLAPLALLLGAGAVTIALLSRRGAPAGATPPAAEPGPSVEEAALAGAGAR
jgi:hypothetical protein